MRRTPAALATAVLATLVLAAPALTATSVAPRSAAAGWPWPVLAKTSPRTGWSTPTYRAWYSRPVTGEQFSSPAIADLDGNGVADVVAGFPDGRVHVFR